METSETTRVHWRGLSEAKKAFVAAYTSNAYSIRRASESVGLSISECKKFLSDTSVRKAISELQAELDNIDFLNENWVRAQLLDLYPKVIGEEKIPGVDSEGNQVEVKKFYPDIAMKILEYVAPKKKDGDVEKPASFNFNITMPGKDGK